MLEENDHQLEGVYAREVLEFVKEANAFCEFLEDASALTPVDFIGEAVQRLARLYADFLKLEPFEPVLESENERFVTEQDWAHVFQIAMSKLGDHNEYLRIAEDDEFDKSDLVTHKISEDFADIYQDIKNFILQYRQGVEEIMNDALYELRDNFEQYWSIKLLNALSAMNNLYVKKVNPETDSPEESGGSVSNPTYDNSFFTRLQDRNDDEEDD